MKSKTGKAIRTTLLISLIALTVGLSTRLQADTAVCGGTSITLPFTDVPAGNVFFCSIASAFVTGLTGGTTPTTYSPAAAVNREQMAAFVTRTMDQTLKRGSRRASVDQFWTTQVGTNLGLTSVGATPKGVKSDGADLWVANSGEGTVSRVRASDGRLLETWSGAPGARAVLVAMGKVFVTESFLSSGGNRLYQIDPTLAPGAVATLTSGLGGGVTGIAYDGQRIWTANTGNGSPGTGSISIVSVNPVSVNTVTFGFDQPGGIVFDGTNMWVTDQGDDTIKKLDVNGSIILSVPVGGNDPDFPVFDGINIWVPVYSSHLLVVVRATGALAGTIIATLSGNGMSFPGQAAFDGERIMVTNDGVTANSVSLWKASDLTTIGNFSTGAATRPFGLCSDGLNFWITLKNPAKLARF